MATLSACIAATAQELGLKESDVRQIAERVDAYRKGRVAKGDLDRLEAEVRKFAAAQGEEAKLAAALKRKQTALNIIRRDAFDRDVTKLKADRVEPHWAIVAKLVGTYAGNALSRVSVSARRVALEGAWQGGMLSELRKAVPGFDQILKRPKESKPYLDDIVREWRAPGSTTNKDARTTAEILAKYAEAARLEANRAGANIGSLKDWGGGQSHDETKLMRAGAAKWVQDIIGKLDLERSFGAGTGEAEAAQILAGVWDDITLGRGSEVTLREKGGRVGPANLANSLAKHRVLQFKTADDWLAYSDVYARGNVITGMLDHFHSMARTVSLMQVLGPNPQVMLDSILEDQRRQVKEGGGTQAQKLKRLKALDADLNKTDTVIGRAFAEVMGDTFRPGNLTSAKINAGVRGVQSMAKLGGAVVSSVTDLVTYAHAMRFQGRGILESYGDAFTTLLSGKTRAEQREVALLLGVGHDTMLGDIHARFAADDNLPGKMNRSMNFFFKLSGLTWWTDRLTNSFAAVSSAQMALNAGKAWSGLNPAYRRTLEIHGFNEQRWALVAGMVQKVGDYNYVLPDAIANLPDSAFGAKPAEITRNRREFELDLRAFFADEAAFGIIKGDDRTRMFALQGTSPGTTKGEVIRYLMQFKSFPIAYTQKILVPAIKGRAGEGRDWGGVAHMIAMSTILGYGAMTVKDFLKNRTPKDPRRYETILAAFLQGGGAGIYGDFLFAANDRFGGGLLEDLAGPTAGNVSQAYELLQKVRDNTLSDAERKVWGDAYYLALNNTPYMNLWYTRAALDLAILNQMQEWISPGTLRRREKRLEKDFGQRYITEPRPLVEQ